MHELSSRHEELQGVSACHDKLHEVMTEVRVRYDMRQREFLMNWKARSVL